jgi:hypothetical protein
MQKRKRSFYKFFKQISDFCLWRFFLSIKTTHMHKYILAIQNLLVVFCISYNKIKKIKKKNFFFRLLLVFLSLIKQWSLLQSRTCSSGRNHNFPRFRCKMCLFFLSVLTINYLTFIFFKKKIMTFRFRLFSTIS